MAYYDTCPLCGAHLDPREKCDCYFDEYDPDDELRELGLLKLHNSNDYNSVNY